jgi:hypothetical protein
MAANGAPFWDTVIRSVAMAIDGAAPNRPAKLLGRRVSLSAANANTAIPPAKPHSILRHHFAYGTIWWVTLILGRQFGAFCTVSGVTGALPCRIS